VRAQKKSIREIRRAELSRAAFEELVVSGIRGTTLDRVAARAGISKSAVLHHFKDKDDLFEAVMRKANSVLHDCVVELLRYADTPMERLYAVFIGNFAPPVFRPEVCHAWINLCSDAPYNAQNQRIQHILHARLDSNLISALRPMVPQAKLEGHTKLLRTMIDGIWLRASLHSPHTPMSEALEQMDQMMALVLNGEEVLLGEAKSARIKMEDLAKIILTSHAFSAKGLI
jgi:TetR/AcrR family transcriptional repressor of bet genes